MGISLSCNRIGRETGAQAYSEHLGSLTASIAARAGRLLHRREPLPARLRRSRRLRSCRQDRLFRDSGRQRLGRVLLRALAVGARHTEERSQRGGGPVLHPGDDEQGPRARDWHAAWWGSQALDVEQRELRGQLQPRLRLRGGGGMGVCPDLRAQSQAMGARPLPFELHELVDRHLGGGAARDGARGGGGPCADTAPRARLSP